jgi:hypothetical protein
MQAKAHGLTVREPSWHAANPSAVLTYAKESRSLSTVSSAAAAGTMQVVSSHKFLPVSPCKLYQNT